jgi:hypothetical protein
VLHIGARFGLRKMRIEDNLALAEVRRRVAERDKTPTLHRRGKSRFIAFLQYLAVVDNQIGSAWEAGGAVSAGARPRVRLKPRPRGEGRKF